MQMGFVHNQTKVAKCHPSEQLITQVLTPTLRTEKQQLQTQLGMTGREGWGEVQIKEVSFQSALEGGQSPCRSDLHRQVVPPPWGQNRQSSREWSQPSEWQTGSLISTVINGSSVDKGATLKALTWISRFDKPAGSEPHLVLEFAKQCLLCLERLWASLIFGHSKDISSDLIFYLPENAWKCIHVPVCESSVWQCCHCVSFVFHSIKFCLYYTFFYMNTQLFTRGPVRGICNPPAGGSHGQKMPGYPCAQL